MRSIRKKFYSKVILFCFSLSTIFINCNKAGDEPIPYFLHIPKINFSTKSDNSQGSASQDIKDAWVFINNELIGVFEMPCTVPILKSGQGKLLVFPGIKVNGRENDRKFYPFFKPYEINLNMTAGKIDTITPSSTYKDDVVFKWIEDFEDGSSSLSKSGSRSSDTLKITTQSNDVFEYNGISQTRSAKVLLSNAIGYFEYGSNSNFELPRNTSDIYLEVNYKSNIDIGFGFYPIGSSQTSAGVPIYSTFPSTTWKKAYIRISSEVNNPDYKDKRFKIFIFSSNYFKLNDAFLLIDNIKLLHF